MSSILEEKAEKIASFNGIDVYQVRTAKFKTNTINIFFHDNISRENASRNAMIPAVLRRGCLDYPTFQDISLYLEQLYGAGFDCGVTKKGERQIIQFTIEFVSDKYTGSQADLFRKSFDLIYKIITSPIIENDAFKNEYVEQEKDNLKKLIERRINDKMQYAVERCYEEMCKDEPFGIHEYGSISDLDSIKSKDLYEYYISAIRSLPMDVFITGDMEDAVIQDVVDRLKQLERGDIKTLSMADIKKDNREQRDVTEKMSVNQGKLSLGFRTNVSPDDKQYYSLLVYNAILGGGTHSKLFQNVREKASLAYYAFSRLEKFKGLMVISSGIELENKEKAMNIILEQLDEIKKGNITDAEYDSTLKTIETGIKSLLDNQLNIVDFYLSQSIVNTNDTFDSIIEKVKQITKQDVVKVAQNIQLDTVYFLTSVNQ